MLDSESANYPITHAPVLASFLYMQYYISYTILAIMASTGVTFHMSYMNIIYRCDQKLVTVTSFMMMRGQGH